MVVLTEQVEIPASYEKMEAWTANFEEEFVKWSPYHIDCNLYNGNYHAGSKVRFREIVMVDSAPEEQVCAADSRQHQKPFS